METSSNLLSSMQKEASYKDLDCTMSFALGTQKAAPFTSMKMLLPRSTSRCVSMGNVKLRVLSLERSVFGWQINNR